MRGRIKDKLWWAAAVFLLTALTYELAHHQATAWRGYEAVGGELLIWALPAMLWALRRTAADWTVEIKEIYGEQAEE